MGQEIQTTHFRRSDFTRFDKVLDREYALLKEWFASRHFSSVKNIGGLELEACLIDAEGNPQPRNEEFLERAGDPDIVPELSKFNFELNAAPQPIAGSGLRLMEQSLVQGCARGRRVAESMGLSTVAIGILPTLIDQHLCPANMTSLKRFAALNEQFLRIRGGKPARMEIVGRERLSAEHMDVMLEGAATSFQIHWQIPQDLAARYYNAIAIASAVTIAIGGNAPFMFGKLLWEESRIPVFEQAFGLDNPDQRVTFGRQYVTSLEEIFRDNRDKFDVILPLDLDEPLEKLAHLRLHNGSLWRWNRPLIGFDDDGTPHLRMEHRVLPAGPTPIDMIANMAFFYGLVEWMVMEPHAPEFRLEFAAAKQNFYAAARHGLDASVDWYDGKRWSMHRLILSVLLPQVRKGLEALHVDAGLISRYLAVIVGRVERGATGAAFQRKWTERHGRDLPALVRAYRELQDTGDPVHMWPLEQ